MDAWFTGLKRGRAFVSSGPLLEMQVGTSLPGDTVQLPPGGGEVTITGQLRSITELEEIALVCNGELVQTFPLRRSDNSLNIDFEHSIERSGWCHLRTEGDSDKRFPLDVGYAQAFTNPIWFQVGDEPIRNPQSVDYAIRWIDKLQELADAWPGWRSESEKAHVFGQFEQARQVYRSKLN